MEKSKEDVALVYWNVLNNGDDYEIKGIRECGKSGNVSSGWFARWDKFKKLGWNARADRAEYWGCGSAGAGDDGRRMGMREREAYLIKISTN